MSSVLKKLFRTPDIVGKLTAKEYYDGFKKIFSKVAVSESGGDEVEDDEESVPAGEAFFFVSDFRFADEEAPLLWVGALSNEWKVFRKSNQNKSSFAKGYAEKASEDNPDPEAAAFIFTVTDGKALKETIFKIVEKTVKKYCSKKINLTLPTLKTPDDKPITQPVVASNEANNYVKDIIETFNLYKNTDGMKAPSAKIKLRFELEALIANRDKKQEKPEDTKKIETLSKALKEGLQWKEQIEDLAFNAKSIAHTWNKCLKSMGGSIKKVSEIQDFKEQRKRYMELRMIIADISDWQKKEHFYFQDERDAKILPTEAANQLMQLKSTIDEAKTPCLEAIKLLTTDNPNAARLEQAYRDLSPKDDIRIAKIGLEISEEKLKNCDKNVAQRLKKYAELLETIKVNPNLHAVAINKQLTELSNSMFKHRDNMPAELTKDIGDKIYEARREIGLSGYLDDTKYKSLCEAFDNFMSWQKDFESKWANTEPSTEDEKEQKQFMIIKIQNCINFFQRSQKNWEKEVKKHQSLNNIEVQQNLKHVRKMYFDLNAWVSQYPLFKTMKDFGKELKTYDIKKDSQYKTDALSTQKNKAKEFMKKAVHTPQIVSLDAIKEFFGKKQPSDTAKPKVVTARIKKLREDLAEITTWLVDAKAYKPSTDLETAKKQFKILEALIYTEINELQSIKKSVALNTTTTENEQRLNEVYTNNKQLSDELQTAKNELEKETNPQKKEEKKAAIKAIEKKMQTQLARANHLQNRISEGGAALALQEKNFLAFTDTERQELADLLNKWQKAKTTELAQQAKAEIAQKLKPHNLEAKEQSDLAYILDMDTFKSTTFKATVEKSKNAVAKANTNLNNDYKILADRLTFIVKQYDKNSPTSILTAIKNLSDEITLRLPDAETIKSDEEILGLDYYKKIENLRWHCQRLQNEIQEVDTIDKKIASAIFKEKSMVMTMPIEDVDFIPQATNVLQAISNWQKRNTPPKDSKGEWALPDNKDTHQALENYKQELIEKVKKSPVLDGTKPDYSGLIATANQEIEELRRGISETLNHPTVKQWDEQLKAFQKQFEDKTISVLTPNLQEELDKIKATVAKIRMDYYNIEDDLYRKEEEKTFAAFKGEFDIFKNRGFQVPDKEMPILQKTYERIINRVNARIKNGESPESIRASIAHIPFNFIPDKCIADLAAWQATRKEVLARHFESTQKDTTAKMYADIKFTDVPEATIQQTLQKARNLINNEEIKSAVTELAEKTPEELDAYINKKELERTKEAERNEMLGKVGTASVDITLMAAKVLKKIVDKAKSTAEKVGSLNKNIDSTNKTLDKLGLGLVISNVDKGIVKDAATVASVLGGVSSILTGVMEVVSLLQSEPKTNPQTAFDKFVKKGLQGLSGLVNIGVGIPTIVDAFQAVAGEVLIGFGLAADLINFANALYSLGQHEIALNKTQKLQNLAEREVNPLAAAFEQETKSIEKKIAKDYLDIVTTTMSAAGNITQLAGLGDPTGSAIATGKAIVWLSKGISVAGKLVLTINNIADMRKAGRLIKKAAAGDRESQLKVMSHSSYYAKMFIAMKAFDGDPLAKKYLIDRNMSSTDLEDEFTAKSVLQDALLYASEETNDTFWYDPVSGDFTSVGVAAFESFLKSTSETINITGAKIKMFFGKTPAQNYQQLQTMGLISQAGLHQVFANYIKFQSKKLGVLHPHRSRLAASFASSIKVLYKPLKEYHDTLSSNITIASKEAKNVAEINHATQIAEIIEPEVAETGRLLQLFDLYELTK
jgi:hypothetical protein